MRLSFGQKHPALITEVLGAEEVPSSGARVVQKCLASGRGAQPGDNDRIEIGKGDPLLFQYLIDGPRGLPSLRCFATEHYCRPLKWVALRQVQAKIHVDREHRPPRRS